MTTDNQANGTGSRRPRYIPRRIIIATLIIILGVVGARFLISTKPKVSRRPAEKIAPLVTVAPLEPLSQVITVSAMGTVIPSREIVLKTSVGGEVIAVDKQFAPGGLFRQGTEVLQIDPRDYELVLQQKKKALSDAEYAYKLEQGRQDVAQREWDLLYGNSATNGVESDLALRKPHLEKVEADMESARAELELAELNLARTKVTAPFNSLILNRYVDRGAFVAPQEKLADLVGTDEYWVQVSLPLDRLQWLKIPGTGAVETGSPARILYRQGNVRKGQVSRLLGDLTKEGRMGRLLVTVPDPLGLSSGEGKGEPLIIGEYVRVEIEGEELHDVYSIPRAALRNDREIWVVTAENRLAIRPVETIWRDETHVLVRDSIQPGEKLVVSDLSVPVDGMEVRVDKAADVVADTMPEKSEENR